VAHRRTTGGVAILHVHPGVVEEVRAGLLVLVARVALVGLGAGVEEVVLGAIGVSLAIPRIAPVGCATGGVGLAARLRLRSERLGLGACLRPRAPRDVGVLALRVPLAARDPVVREAHGVAQLVELLLRELARIPDPEVVEREVRERDALELVDAIAERLDHPVDLAVLALVDRDPEPGVLALARQDLDLRGQRRRAVVEGDPVAERPDLVRRQLAVDLDVIRLRHVARRCEQPSGELAVVREEQDAFRVEVEPADGLHRHRQVREVVHHRRAPTVIGDRGDAPLRLVEEDVERVERDHGLTIDLDLIVVWIDLGPQRGHDLAIDLNATGGDQLLGFAPSRDPRRRKVPLQANGLAHGAVLLRAVAMRVVLGVRSAGLE